MGGIKSIQPLSKLNHLRSLFKNLFHLLWISSMMSQLFLCIIMINDYLFRIDSTPFPWIYHSILYILSDNLITINMMTILSLLMCRLHYVFKGSPYEISKRTKFTFGTIFFILIALIITALTAMLIEPYYWTYWHIYFLSLLSFGILYILTTIAIIIMTANKMVRLTSLREPTFKNVFDATTTAPTATILNQRQIKTVENTTKYIGLLVLGIGMTVFMAAGAAVFAGHIYVYIFLGRCSMLSEVWWY